LIADASPFSTTVSSASTASYNGRSSSATCPTGS
jgi:hypothetical protein